MIVNSIVAGGGVDLPSLTNPASASQVLTGRDFINASGERVVGTMPSLTARTYTPATTNQTIQAGYYLSGAQTIQGDYNLRATNIRSGVTIFGVTGTYEGEAGQAWQHSTGSVAGGSSATGYTVLDIPCRQVTNISYVMLTYAGIGGSGQTDIIGFVWQYGSSYAQATIGGVGARNISMTTMGSGNYTLRWVKYPTTFNLIASNSNGTLTFGSATYYCMIVGT